MIIAAFGRFMRHSRIPKCLPWHIYSRWWREAAERECARAQGVGLGERVARTAKQPQGPAREPKRSELLRKSGKEFSLIAK